MTELTAYGSQTLTSLEPDRRAAIDLPTVASSIPVTTEAEYVRAGEFVREIKVQHAAFKEKHDSVVKPLQDVVKTLTGWFRPGLDALASAEKILKQSMLNYRAAVREQEEALARAAQMALTAARAAASSEEQARHNAIARDAIAQLAPAPSAPGVGARTLYRAEVIDLAVLPREYLVPNQALLDKLAREHKGSISIPGVRFYSEESLAIRK